ncbi:MAG: ATP-binding protein [candidate division Zixibacteria bacterium]|nr:ATP-binding protein [candidate division Zixibacteria bacterium]
MQKPMITGNRISIPSTQEYLPDVDIFIEGILRGYGINESIIADIAISVSELVNNAIDHGNQKNEEKRVIVTIEKNSEAVSLTVTDEGTGFNPDELDDPLAEENLLKEVGRGIFIVRSLMDKVDIAPSKKGTKITFTRALK